PGTLGVQHGQILCYELLPPPLCSGKPRSRAIEDVPRLLRRLPVRALHHRLQPCERTVPRALRDAVERRYRGGPELVPHAAHGDAQRVLLRHHIPDLERQPQLISESRIRYVHARIILHAQGLGERPSCRREPQAVLTWQDEWTLRLRHRP